MKFEKFGNVWDALADTPEEACNLTLRSDLMTAIEKSVARQKLSQGEAAKRLGITRPRMNDLLREKMSKFSLDALAMLATKAGLKVEMRVTKAGKRAA